MIDRDFARLQDGIAEIWDVTRRLGLDPFPTHFEMLPASIMYEFGAYGLPGRFSHWTHGKTYHQMKTAYDYGLSKIYELVINTNPTYAFLMEGNSLLQNKLVVAHVLAHSDFFKHNLFFQHTNRQMVEGAAVNADRIRRYEFRFGKLEVERFLDAVLTIDEHVDPNVLLRREAEGDEAESEESHLAPSGPYDDILEIGNQDKAARAARARQQKNEPEKDLLLYLAEHAPDLKPWQRDILQIVRSEMLYFVPQMQTKICNEGWAAYWHVQILRQLDLTEEEYVDFARLHSGVLAPSRRQINPYYVGMKILEDIKRRWDEPTDEERRKFGRAGGEGLKKLFEVREVENDVSLLRNYLTKDLVDELDLYVYRLEGDKWVIVEKDWEKVRDQLTGSLTNFGQPYIVVQDGDYRRSRELYLRHCFEGQQLDVNYAEKTLRYVHQLWGRPIHLETVVDGKKTLLTFDGAKHVASRVA